MVAPNTVSRTDASTTIPQDYSNALLDNIFESSVALSIFPRIPLGTKVTNFPLLATLPTAGFVTEALDNTGIKPNSNVSWKNKVITAEEIAVIVPIHENVLEDQTISSWDTITPAIAEAMGVVVDGAIFYGTNKPTSWRAGLISTANSAGNVVSFAGGTTNTTDLVARLNELFQLVEKDGNEVTDFVSGPRFKGKLRGLRATTGELIYSDLKGGSTGDILGAGVDYMKNGVWNDAIGIGLALDRSKVRVGVRSDMSYKVLDQASITSTDGTVINLAERDMVALRVKMRLGWEIADNVNRLASSPTAVALLTATSGNS